MAHLSPLSRFAARHAEDGDPAAPMSGLALVGARLNESCRIDPASEKLVLPVSIPLAVTIFNWMDAGEIRQGEESAQQFFAERLAKHPDARLRAIAASMAKLSPQAAARLALDPAHEVRRALAMNERAAARLPLEECIALAASDEALPELIFQSLRSAAWEARRRASESASQSLRAKEDARRVYAKLRAAAVRFLESGDYEVREAARSAIEACSGEEEEANEFRLPLRFRRSRRPASREAFCGRPGDFGCAIGLLDASTDRAEAELERLSPLLGIPVETYADFIAQLPHTPVSERFVEAFARHPSHRVREAAAERENLTPNALDALKLDSNYDVRLALLSNDCALPMLSRDEILMMLRGDAGLIRETFGWRSRSEHAAQVLEEAYADAGDPGIREVLAALED